MLCFTLRLMYSTKLTKLLLVQIHVKGVPDLLSGTTDEAMHVLIQGEGA
jgi:hypothetical protein